MNLRIFLEFCLFIIINASDLNFAKHFHRITIILIPHKKKTIELEISLWLKFGSLKNIFDIVKHVEKPSCISRLWSLKEKVFLIFISRY